MISTRSPIQCCDCLWVNRLDVQAAGHIQKSFVELGVTHLALVRAHRRSWTGMIGLGNQGMSRVRGLIYMQGAISSRTARVLPPAGAPVMAV